MSKYMAFFLLFLNFNCTTNHPQNSEVKAANEKAPYDLQIKIDKAENGEFSLIASIKLENGSYIASPFSNNNFTGLFNIALEDNEHLFFDKMLIETPRSVETIDGIEGVPVNWIRVNTTYQQPLKVLSEKAFEVAGLIKFTIEPRCTFEQIPFTIAYAAGEMMIEKNKLKDEKITENSMPSIGNFAYNNYKNGEKEGVWKAFYENGQPKNEGNYKAGKKEGFHRMWQANGVLTLAGFYRNGKANGLMKWYHEQGHLAAEGQMKDDKRNGAWKICGIEPDDVCIDAYFEEEKRSGLWKIYHNSGKLWKEQTWENDKIVAEKCWDETGLEIVCIDY